MIDDVGMYWASVGCIFYYYLVYPWSFKPLRKNWAKVKLEPRKGSQSAVLVGRGGLTPVPS